ncbi:hypothetical protein OYB22_24170, partial [Escherichia coli]|nr:hypothetical protein [Escherichia coli]
VFGAGGTPKTHLVRQFCGAGEAAVATKHFLSPSIHSRNIRGEEGVSLEIGNFCTLSALFNQSWFVRG